MEKINKRITATAILFILTFVFVAFPSKTYASSPSYKYIGMSATKVGKYYYKTSSSNNLFRSKNKYSGYRKVLGHDNGRYYHDKYCTNGKYIYTVGSSGNAYYILRYKVSGKKPKVLKKLPAGKANGNRWSVSEAVGNNVLLTCSNFSAWKKWTYKFNTKANKLKLVLGNCEIVDRSGRYVLAVNEYKSDTGPRKATLYKLKSSGKLEKIKVLGSKVGVGGPVFAGNKVYYAIEDSDYVHLYRCNRDGSNNEKLESFAYTREYQQILISNYTSKSCEVNFSSDGKYRYTYSTKELELLEDYSY